MFDTEVYDTHDIKVDKMGDYARFGEETLHIVFRKPHVQDFDGGLRPQVDVFAEIDLCEPSLPYFTNQAIVANLFAQTVDHENLSP